jgi:hypothetical protein
MSENIKDSQEQETKFEDIEARRFEAEIKKNTAESKKLSIEAREIEKRLTQRWFSLKVMIQSAIGGIVGAALLAAWLISYFSPVLSAKHELATLDNAKLKIILETQKEKNDRMQNQLQEVQATLKVQLESFKEQNETFKIAQVEAEARTKLLQTQLRDVSNKFYELAEKQSITDKKEKYTQIAIKTGKEVEALGRQITQLKSEKIQTAARTDQIAQQIQNLPKIRPRVYIHIRKEDQREKAIEIGFKLEDAGFSAPGIERLVEIGPNTNQLRFFRKAEVDEAAKIVGFLSSIGIETELVDLSAKYETSSAIRPRHYELWFSPVEF